MSTQNFALIDGKLAFIEDYQHLVGNYKDRPRATCPISHCGAEMVLVLPESKRKAHFRHKSDSVGEHSPESIWHSGVKYHLAKQLKHGSKINFNWKCKSDTCKGKHSLPPLLSKKHNYIDIDQKKIGKFLPDISLYSDTEILAAIEIENTHQSTHEKIAFYNSMKLPWFEITVKSEDDYQSIMDWKGGSGLEPFLSKHYYPSSLPENCPSCKELAIQEEKRLLEKKVRENEKKKRELAANKKLLEARKDKEKIGNKIFKLLSQGKTIPLGFNLVCRHCTQTFPQHLRINTNILLQSEVDREIYYNSDIDCDIRIIDEFLRSQLIILLHDESPEHKYYKQELIPELKSNGIPYIEIKVSPDRTSFKVTDSDRHLKLEESYSCAPCEEWIKNRRIEKIREKREIAAKEAMKQQQAEIDDCKQKIVQAYEIIRLNSSKSEKEEALEEIRQLKHQLASLEV